MNTSDYTLDSVGEIVASQRRFFRTGATLPVSWRIHQLKRGFREFTHPQTVLRGSRWLNLSLREHPYSGKKGQKKMWLLRLFER